MVAVLALLSTGLSLSLSRADLAAVVVAEPRLLCAKADRASSRFSTRPTAMVVVLALLSTGLSLSLSRADLAAVVIAEPRLLCAKADTIAASARLGHLVRRRRRAHRHRRRPSPPPPLSPEPSTAAVAEPPAAAHRRHQGGRWQPRPEVRAEAASAMVVANGVVGGCKWRSSHPSLVP
uniref:OSJNBa0072K14.11 protein n=1 Tax=Oryza sativa subsp. japonica TaxID=39947 RepID=Q7XQ64_ORYSJ|nr:OSJNBa0072K14.11 [Oryza sativa Japonica Group]